MPRNEETAKPMSVHASDWRLLTLRCGIPALESVLVGQLEQAGLVFDTAAPTVLLVDAPCGFALRQLPQMEQHDRVIVLTNNSCPEYWEDLWDHDPAGLLIGMGFDERLFEVLMLVSRGARYRYPPSGASALTSSERAMLRLVACGWDDRRIAQHLHRDEREVSTMLAMIYQTLGVDNRVQAALYYWGSSELYG